LNCCELKACYFHSAICCPVAIQSHKTWEASYLFNNIVWNLLNCVEKQSPFFKLYAFVENYR
jgi:hypothetical protein